MILTCMPDGKLFCMNFYGLMVHISDGKLFQTGIRTSRVFHGSN